MFAVGWRSNQIEVCRKAILNCAWEGKLRRFLKAQQDQRDATSATRGITNSVVDSLRCAITMSAVRRYQRCILDDTHRNTYHASSLHTSRWYIFIREKYSGSISGSPRNGWHKAYRCVFTVRKRHYELYKQDLTVGARLPDPQ
jgi:hypothetical protein